MFTEANGRGEHHFQGVDKSVSNEMKMFIMIMSLDFLAPNDL
jgi:hypothetical protein